MKLSTRLFAVLSVIVLVVSVCSASLYAEQITVLGGGEKGWDGWTSMGQSWRASDMQRTGNPCPVFPHMKSDERETGALRSPEFTINGDVIRFWIDGWDGRSGGANSTGFLLKRAGDGETLRSQIPPLQDGFVSKCWLVSDLRGQRVYFEAFDNNTDTGFAWVGLARIEEVAKEVPAARSPYRALPLAGGLGAWSVIKRDGQQRPTNPYLSSLAKGEQMTGTARSPEFTVRAPTVRLAIRGWDGQQGGQSGNRVELVASENGKVLRVATPPGDDFPKWTDWDVSNLIGNKVYIRAVDANSNTSFAWLGLDEIDAGSSFHARFSDSSSLNGWRVEGVERSYTERDGVPFLAEPTSPVTEGEAFVRGMGFRARRLFLLGMTHSLDQGCPTWGDPNDMRSRFFVGDRLGEVRVRYKDGATDVYPLILGESAEWGRLFFENPEPFASDSKARAALAKSLRLYPQGPSTDGNYMAVILCRPATIDSLEVLGAPEKAGSPVLVGLTVEPMPGEGAPGGVALPHGLLSSEVASFVEKRPLRRQGEGEAQARADLEALRNVLYTTESNFPKHVRVEVPAGYEGPKVSFRGDAYAEVLTNMFYANLSDIASKVDDKGMYHTSTNNAPSWGGYAGFGTYRKNAGSYYTHTWSRDMGRSMGELVALGRMDKAKLCADYVFNRARLWEDDAKLQYQGHRLPRHVCRIMNLPGDEGCFENDGHGLTGLFIYNLWRRLPDKADWLRARWRDVRGLGDWVTWQLDHPEISGATRTLRTDSECSAGVGHSVYADAACIEALRGLAEMADSIGEKSTAAQWRGTAQRLKWGVEREYIIDEAPYGRAWTLTSSGWPNRATVLGPVLFLPDRRGFAPDDDDPAWRRITEAAYRRLISTYRPFGFYGVAMGYGQGFVTQAALLFDRMHDASEMLNWAAKATYCASFEPYIVPEGCEIEPNGRFWHRTGDLGNGVQEAEIIKAMRLVIGVDDNDPRRLRFLPRLPLAWTGIKMSSYPALIQSSGGASTAMLDYTLERRGDGLHYRVKSDKPMPDVLVRLGPFDAKPDSENVFLNARPAIAGAAFSGDSWWVSVRVPSGSRGFSVDVSR